MKTFQTAEWETGSVVIKLGQLKLNSKSLRMCSELYSVHYPTNTLRTSAAHFSCLKFFAKNEKNGPIFREKRKIREKSFE